MPKTLKMLMHRLMNQAGEGTDLPGDTLVLDDDEHQPGTPEDRGDFLPGDDLDPEALNAVAAGAVEDVTAAKEAAAADTGAAAKASADESALSDSVPHARFNEVNMRRKAAEQEAERLRAENEALKAGKAAATKPDEKEQDKSGKGAAAPEIDVDAKEQAYLDALMEGNTDVAKQIRREINQQLMAEASSATLKSVRAEMEERQQAEAQANAGKLLATTANAVVSDYPFLDDPAHSEVLDMIEARRDALIAKGVTAHEALRQAADFIAPRFAPEGFTPAKSLEKPAPKTDSRQAAAVERGAKASLAQPPVPVAGMGNRATGSDAKSVANMSDEDFDRLTAAEKKALRGD